MKKVLLKSMLLFVAILCVGVANAQTVSGTVSEENGPLPGASVVVKGTSNGTSTDFDGNYTLNNVPSDAVLVYSYVGYATQEIAVGGRSRIDITMTGDNTLDEVVLIGYGTQRIKDATGSLDVIGTEEFNGGIIASPEQLIQGKTAGVQITSTSGEPGAAVNLTIRGTNGIRAASNPLYVIDGVPLGADSPLPGAGDIGFGAGTARNPLNFLNPNDIESVNILKDASATAIYGSRGANGVVIIQTKQGRGSSKGIFELTSSLSISEPANDFDLLNAQQFLDASRALGNTPLDFGSDTDFQDVITRTSVSRSNNLSYAKSYTGGNVRASFGYDSQFGVLEDSELERITARVNATHKFFDDKLKIDLQTTISRVNDQAPPIGTNAGFQGEILGSAYSANPTIPNDPNFNPGGTTINPRNLLETFRGVTNTNRFIGNLSAQYNFTDEFAAKILVGYDEAGSDRSSIVTSDVFALTNGAPGNGRAIVNDNDIRNRLLTGTLTYDKTWGKNTVSALAGYEFQEFRTSGRNLQAFGLRSTNFDQIVNNIRNDADFIQDLVGGTGSFQQFGFSESNGLFVNRLFPDVVSENVNVSLFNSNVQALTSNLTSTFDELQSFFGRFNYTYDNKYLFTFTARADGSTRFGENNTYGFFPSGAFAWRLDQEDFIGDNVSTLKLRVNAGITGSQDGLGTQRFLSRERFGGIGIDNGGQIANPGGTAQIDFQENDLQWEETLQFGVGFDFGFNNDRFNGTVDFYRKETTELLLQTASAQPAANPFVFQNLPDATVINQGIEVALSYDFIQSEDYNFNVGLNVAYNDNQFEDFGGEIQFSQIFGQGLTGAFAQLLSEGRSLFSFFLRDFQGFNAEGIEPNQDQIFVGEDALPDVTAGLNLSARVKNWDFSASFTGQFGFSIYNNTANGFFTAGSFGAGRNVTTDIAAGATGTILPNGESILNTPAVSTRFLESGDFVRLQNASIGYNWDLSGDGLFKTLRMYVNGQNLFVITDYSGLDPEVTVQNSLNNIQSRGVDNLAFPRPRTYTIGLNATF